MCVIIYKPKGIVPDKELLQIRHKSNSDSWGFVYFDLDYLSYFPIARTDKNFDDIWEIIKEQGDKEWLLHFRTATSGKEKDSGVQPILANGVFFFLNGNLSGYFGKQEPDTILYAREYLEKLPPDFLENEKIREKIEEDCVCNNAVMAFMDSKGKVRIFNQDRGVWEKGMWFSNPRVGRYAGFGYSGVYPYKEGEKRYNI